MLIKSFQNAKQEPTYQSTSCAVFLIAGKGKSRINENPNVLIDTLKFNKMVKMRLQSPREGDKKHFLGLSLKLFILE